MPKPFEREPRYIVLKMKDIEAYLPPGSFDLLATLGNAIHEGRMKDGKAPFNAVVVEQDWPEFEPTWQAIEHRMTGNPIEPRFKIALRVKELELEATLLIHRIQYLEGRCSALSEINDAKGRILPKLGIQNCTEPDCPLCKMKRDDNKIN